MPLLTLLESTQLQVLAEEGLAEGKVFHLGSQHLNPPLHVLPLLDSKLAVLDDHCTDCFTVIAQHPQERLKDALGRCWLFLSQFELQPSPVHLVTGPTPDQLVVKSLCDFRISSLL